MQVRLTPIPSYAPAKAYHAYTSPRLAVTLAFVMLAIAAPLFLANPAFAPFLPDAAALTSALVFMAGVSPVPILVIGLVYLAKAVAFTNQAVTLGMSHPTPETQALARDMLYSANQSVVPGYVKAVIVVIWGMWAIPLLLLMCISDAPDAVPSMAGVFLIASGVVQLVCLVLVLFNQSSLLALLTPKASFWLNPQLMSEEGELFPQTTLSGNDTLAAARDFLDAFIRENESVQAEAATATANA